MFVHCMPRYIVLSFHWNKKMWDLLQICIINFHGHFKNHELDFQKFITKLH